MSLAYDCAINRYNNRCSDHDYISSDLLENAINNEHCQAPKEQFIWEDGNDENLYKYHNILLNNSENGLTENNDDIDDSWKDFEYIGNVLTDSYPAMYELSESWEYNGFVVMEPSFYHLVFDKVDPSDDGISKMNFGCNTTCIVVKDY